MVLSSSKQVAAACAVIAATLALSMPDASAQRRATAAVAGPFSSMAGSWSGSGTIALQSGTSERIRCRATYSVSEGGNALQQQLRCASDSYKFELTSNVNHEAGAISGVWSEALRNASGNVYGRASGGNINATVDSIGFKASLAVSTRGNRQSVVIRPEGTEFTQVSISLRKS